MKAKEETRKLLKTILLGMILTFLIIIAAPAFIVQYYKKSIYLNIDDVDYTETAIVFGASIKSDGTPSDILKDRLDTAAELYKNSKISQIIVSGDNRDQDYNEPESMLRYLVNNHRIPPEAITKDPAGLRTYDSCARAKTIWNVREAILVTQGYHLVRALFTCNNLGIESYGFSSTNQPYIKEDYFKLREIGAIYKAIIDVYFWRPDYEID